MASSWSVNQSTFVPEIHFSKIMKSNSSLTMNRTASYAIQMLPFFLEDSRTSFCIRMLIIIIRSESGDKSSVTSHWCPQKSRFTKRSPRSSRFEKKGLRGQKFGNLWFNLQRNCLFSAGDTAHISYSLNSAYCPKKTNNNVQRLINA